MALRSSVAWLTPAVAVERITVRAVVALAFLFTTSSVTAVGARVGTNEARPARLALALPSDRMAGALVLALARGRAVGAVGADWARLVTEGAHPARLARARA